MLFDVKQLIILFGIGVLVDYILFVHLIGIIAVILRRILYKYCEFVFTIIRETDLSGNLATK